MNKDAITALIHRLEQDRDAEANAFTMGVFAAYCDTGAVPEDEMGSHQLCNTVLCLAGTVNLMTMERISRDALSRRDFLSRAGSASDARRALGLDNGTAVELFYMRGSGMHDVYMARFDRCPAAQRYAAGIKVLQILRETGKVEWLQAMRCAGM